MAKVNISMEDELLERVDAAARSLYTNRSAYISMVLAQAFMQQDKIIGMVGKTLQEAKDDVLKDK